LSSSHTPCLNLSDAQRAWRSIEGTIQTDAESRRALYSTNTMKDEYEFSPIRMELHFLALLSSKTLFLRHHFNA
jgi:hypothetical protein